LRTDSNRFAITPIERTSPPCFGYGYGNRLGMNIETNKQYFRHERLFLFVCGSAPLDSPLRSVTRATANRRLVALY
jgi:hypothetical protein